MRPTKRKRSSLEIKIEEEHNDLPKDSRDLSRDIKIEPVQDDLPKDTMVVYPTNFNDQVAYPEPKVEIKDESDKPVPSEHDTQETSPQSAVDLIVELATAREKIAELNEYLVEACMAISHARSKISTAILSLPKLFKDASVTITFRSHANR
ncbi:hypothetical protein MMC25_006116 [Agyrium rufum]|nr:hypothetical protein [Agyrium rufum]